MEYRLFGHTDITVSVLDFGCWPMGGTSGNISESRVAASFVTGHNMTVDVGHVAQ